MRRQKIFKFRFLKTEYLASFFNDLSRRSTELGGRDIVTRLVFDLDETRVYKAIARASLKTIHQRCDVVWMEGVVVVEHPEELRSDCIETARCRLYQSSPMDCAAGGS
jgi:hypothetical protein